MLDSAIPDDDLCYGLNSNLNFKTGKSAEEFFSMLCNCMTDKFVLNYSVTPGIRKLRSLR